jgi:PKD repeat protein
MQKGGTNCTFELAVPNGRYTVYAASGDDGSSGPLAVQWSVANGSDTANFAASHQAATTVTFMAAGQYVLRLTASNASAMVFSDLPVSVNPNPNLL